VLELFRLVVLRPWWQRPARPLLTLLGVVLGVALFIAIQVINGSTLGFFRSSVTSFAGKASLSVVGGEAGFPEERLEVVREVEGVATAVPLLEARATFSAPDGTRKSILVFGIDMLNEAAVRSYQGAGQQAIDDPLLFLNQEDSIVLTESFASAHGLALEQPLELMTAFGMKKFTVRGLLAPGGPASAFGGGLAIMDIDGARVMFGKEGRTDRIDVVPRENQDLDRLGERLQAALGPGYRVERPEGQADAFERMVQGYQAVLGFLGSLALLVGGLLVANSLAMSVALRTREIGLVRVAGATRGMLAAAFVLEAAFIGVLGSAAGAVLGWLQARWLVRWVSDSMSRQYVTPIEVSSLQLHPRTLILAMVAGTAVCVLASLWPVVSATRISCLDGLRPVEPEQEAGGLRRSRVLRAVGLGAFACLVPVSYLASSVPVLRAAMPLLALLGAILAAPLLVASLVYLVRGLATLMPGAPFAVLRLACDNLLRYPRRTGGNVLGLVVGLVLVVVIATLHRTFEHALMRQIDRSMPNSVVVTSAGRIVSLQVQPLHESLARELEAVPGVSVAGGIGAYGFRSVRLQYQGVEIALKAWDRPHPATRWEVFDMSDRPAAQAGPELFAAPAEAPACMVSRNFAQKFGIARGAVVKLESPAGALVLQVVGVVNDLAAPNGTVFVTRELYKAWWHDELVTAFAVQAAEGTELDVLRDRLAGQLGASRGVVALTTAGIREQLREVLDESFAYARAIEAAAIFVGLLGLLNTAIVSVLSRTRELGMLRALGMSRRQVRGMVVGEALLQGLFGGVVAALVGAAISVFWLLHELSHTLGWVLDVVLPWGALLQVLGAGVLLGLFAGLAAARRATLPRVVDALATED
jgi:putative ABC transport system permease protein